MNEVIIKKAKLVKKGESFDVLYERINEDEKLPAVIFETHKTPVHPDLKAAYDNLRIHLAILCGYVTVKQVKDIDTPKEELFQDFHVTAISMGKDKDDPGIVLSGHKILSNGKAQILNCPFTRFEESEATRYPFADDLVKKVDRLRLECNAYLFEGKRASDPQQQLPFGDEPVTKIVIDHPEGHGEFFKTTAGGKLPKADLEAQERVLNNGENIDTLKEDIGKQKSSRKKRVAQTAAAPGGIVDEAEEIEQNENSGPSEKETFEQGMNEND